MNKTCNRSYHCQNCCLWQVNFNEENLMSFETYCIYIRLVRIINNVICRNRIHWPSSGVEYCQAVRLLLFQSGRHRPEGLVIIRLSTAGKLHLIKPRPAQNFLHNCILWKQNYNLRPFINVFICSNSLSPETLWCFHRKVN